MSMRKVQRPCYTQRQTRRVGDSRSYSFHVWSIPVCGLNYYIAFLIKMHEIHSLVSASSCYNKAVNYPAVKRAFVHFHSLLFSNGRVALTHPSSFTSESKCWLCSFHIVSLYLPSDPTESVRVQKCVTVGQRRANTLISPHSSFSSTVITHRWLPSSQQHAGRGVDDYTHAQIQP